MPDSAKSLRVPSLPRSQPAALVEGVCDDTNDKRDTDVPDSGGGCRKRDEALALVPAARMPTDTTTVSAAGRKRFDRLAHFT
jgi:hypothetical protein